LEEINIVTDVSGVVTFFVISISQGKRFFFFSVLFPSRQELPSRFLLSSVTN